jgi:hypothetical protein
MFSQNSRSSQSSTELPDGGPQVERVQGFWRVVVGHREVSIGRSLRPECCTQNFEAVDTVIVDFSDIDDTRYKNLSPGRGAEVRETRGKCVSAAPVCIDSRFDQWTLAEFMREADKWEGEAKGARVVQFDISLARRQVLCS